MSDLLEIRTLGGLKIEQGGHLIPHLATRKAEALLVFLACTGHPQPRETLTEMFWPERPQTQALSSMRMTLSRLRQQLSAYVITTRQTIGINIDSPYWLDAAELEEHLARIDTASPLSQTEMHTLAHAVKMYRGDFLAGFFVRGSPDFEAWARGERERLHRAIIAALRCLVQYDLEHERAQEGIIHAARLLEFDPLHEETHRHLMRLLAQAGQRTEALSQFETCCRLLDQELGVAPDTETIRLYESIRTGDGISVQPVIRARHNLPAQLTPFVGREVEISRLADLLAHNRLISLTGPGGIGKTRLALEFAAQHIADFAHGVFFVALAGISSPDNIIPAIAEAVGYQFQNDNRSLKAQLLDYLHPKQVLLVLDNFEHLIDGAALVTDLLQRAQDVKVLVTSRETLELSGEVVVPMGGLDLPETDMASDPLTYSAIRLFVQSAWHNHPDFDPETSRLQHAVRICRSVDGVPLGVLLAASWINTLSLREIADEIERGLDFLAANLRDLPERHRSLRAAFESSWQRLSDAEREVLMRLAIFRGSFSRQAAQQVTGASLQTLKGLMNKSLLRRDIATGRYEMHELVRQFAAEHLDASNQTEAALNDHSSYYLAALHGHEAALKGNLEIEALRDIDDDFNNILVAWDWAIRQGNYTQAGEALDSLWLFCQRRNRRTEALQIIENTLTAADRPAHDADQQILVGRALLAKATLLESTPEAEEAARRSLILLRNQDANREVQRAIARIANLAAARGAYADAQRLGEEALALARQSGDRWEIASRLLDLALMRRFRMGQTQEAAPFFLDALALFREQGNKTGIMYSLYGWATCSHDKAPEEEWNICREALSLARELGNYDEIARVLSNMALLSWALGRFTEALELIQKSLRIRRDVGGEERLWATLGTLGLIYTSLGDLEHAWSSYREALSIVWRLRQIHGVLGIVVEIANVLFKQGRPERAVELLALKETISDPEFQREEVLLGYPTSERLRCELETVLPPGRFAAAWACGQAGDLDSIVHTLLKEHDSQSH